MKRLLTTLAFSGALSLFGADERTASEFAADLGPGISLGYSLEISSGDETAWGNPTISERQIEACRALGFRTVRFPVDGLVHLLSENGQEALDQDFLGHLREIVRWCRARELTVVLACSRTGDDVPRFGRLWKLLAEGLGDLDLGLVFEGFVPSEKSSRAQFGALVEAFHRAVRSADGNNTRRFLMVPLQGDPFGSDGFTWMPPTASDDRLLAGLRLFAPASFTHDHVTPEFDAAEFASGFSHAVDPVRRKLAERGIPLVICETAAERQFRNADRRVPNDDARVRWAYAFASRAQKAGVPVFLRDTGCDPKTGVLDRETGRTTQPAFVRAFVGGSTGMLTPEAAEGLAVSARVGLKEYPKSDRLLVWSLDGRSYACCWGQRMGKGGAETVAGNGLILRFFSSESDGSLRVSTNGEPVDMLHQFFWSDQSETAVETMRAYIYTHGETSLAGRRLVFSLTALNGTTAIVSGIVHLPGVKHEIPFGAGPDVAGALKATPASPKVTVEIPLGDGFLDTTTLGGVSVELKLFPGPWSSSRPLDCRISPIELRALPQEER